MDDDQRAAVIRDLHKHARDAASSVAHMSRKFRELMESGEPEMPAGDVVRADNALQGALRDLPELRQVFAKWARLLDGPLPRLAIRSTGEPERLAVIARYPSGDVEVGHAQRTGTDSAGWRIRLTDGGRIRVSIGLAWGAAVDEMLEAVTRHLDEHGPWWTREGDGG